MNCCNCGQKMRNILGVFLCPSCGGIVIFDNGKYKTSSEFCEEIDRTEKRVWQEKIKKSLDNL